MSGDCDLCGSYDHVESNCPQLFNLYQEAQAEIDRLKAERLRWTKGGEGSHWEGCEDVHWDCRIAQLEAELARRDEKIAELTATTHSQAFRNAELLRFVWWVYQVYARNVQELTSGITEACTYKTEEKAEKGRYGLPIRCWKYIRYLEEYTAGIYNGTYLDVEISMDAKKGIPENKPAYNENANSLLRSAWMIANRNGEETNWEAFKNAVYKELVAEHNVKNSTDNNKGE